MHSFNRGNYGALLFVALFPLASCQGAKRILDGPTSTPPDAIPATIVLGGYTVVDYQGFAPFRTVNSTVTVRVKRSGEDWHTCNKYEARIDTTGTGGVFFRTTCYATFDDNGTLTYFYNTGKPMAPTGTQYEITSILN
jgi:hypothetical protein